MKNYYLSIFLLIMFAGCNYISEPDTKPSGPINPAWGDSAKFKAFVATFDANKADNYYATSDLVFMYDARLLKTITPFSFKDSLAKTVPDSSKPADYHYTKNEGSTSVYYRDKKIFRNTWGVPYMGVHNMMTFIDYGEIFNYKVLLVQNESTFNGTPERPGIYYGLEEKLFWDVNGTLREIDLHKMGISYITGIRGTYEDNIIVIRSGSFIRAYPHYRKTTFLDLSSKAYRTFSIRLD